MSETTERDAGGQQTGKGADHRHHEGSIKETLISLLIAFVMALVFRSYVVEAFVIPTGSMAPTLLGAHMDFQSRQSGFRWHVNPWNMYGDRPFPVQGAGDHSSNMRVPVVTDPMSTSRFTRDVSDGGWKVGGVPKRVGPGDRILVQKYLYTLFPPQRYDVVVFKNPELGTQNYIKRLVGLPNEQVWLVDGDVFARPIRERPDGSVEVLGEWEIRRKPRRVQEALWRPVYDSDYAPLDPVHDGRRWFRGPWDGRGWDADERRVYTCETPERTTLEWDAATWPITDWNWYNEFPEALRGMDRFWLADVRLRAGIEPERDGLSASATVMGVGHEFEAMIGGGRAMLRMRAVDERTGEPGAWEVLAEGAAPALRGGRVTDVEFWHSDQSLSLAVDGRRVLHAPYGWGPSERLEHATGRPASSFDDLRAARNDLLEPGTYRFSQADVRWTFEGSALRLHRVGLDKDLYYRAVPRNHTRSSGPGLGTHPEMLATMGEGEYFMLGDNSANSKDSRRWDTIDRAYAEQMFGVESEGMGTEEYRAAIEPYLGIVPRRMILGKAFFVYFPAPHHVAERIPVPNLGRVRFIR